MKKISTLVLILMMTLTLYNGQAQTYNITTNTTWNAGNPAPCTSNCTFNISAGITLTSNKAFTCSTCTFNGGNISIKQNLTCQPCAFSSDTITLLNAEIKPNSSTTSFTNVVLTASGTADINANTPVNITSSTFKFYNNTYFKNNGGQLNVSGSKLYFYDNSYFLANAGPVNLMHSSGFIVGDGTASSGAYVEMNGPQLNIYDNSYITMANKNNYYFNWGSYHYYTSTSAVTFTTYTTTNNNLNCGGSGQNSCSAPDAYGSATVNSSGLSSGTILPVTITEFIAGYSDHLVNISWTTTNAVNFNYFMVERSAEGTDWQSIATMQANYSAAENSYSFTDASPLDNISYYRLQMVDKDGKNYYSQVISVQTGIAANQIGIFPNPVINRNFNLRTGSSDETAVRVFTMQGQLLYMVSLKGQTQYQINLPAYTPTNNYLVVQVIGGGKINSFNILNK